MNRRAVLKALALGGSSLPLLTQAQTGEYTIKIAPLTALNADWDGVPFEWMDGPALLVRVPKPTTPDKALLEVNGVYLSAYSRVCTHEGCSIKLPDINKKLECPCHGSLFDGVTGKLLGGIASSSLARYRLELRGQDVYAVGVLD